MTIKYKLEQIKFLLKLYDNILSLLVSKKITRNYNFLLQVETQVIVHKTEQEAIKYQINLFENVILPEPCLLEMASNPNDTRMQTPEFQLKVHKNIQITPTECNFIHVTEEKPILICQDIMTAMFDLYDHDSNGIRQRPNAEGKFDIVGTPLGFCNHLINVIKRNCFKFRNPKTGQTLVNTYVITYDKADYMSVLKEMTQLKRSQNQTLYDENSIITENGIIEPSKKGSVNELTSPDGEKIEIRQFMRTRKLRIQLYKLFFEKIKQVDGFDTTEIILDFESSGPYYLFCNEVVQRPERINRLGEGDLAVFIWAIFYRDYHPIIMGKDKDLYLIALLNAHRFPNTLHTSIYNSSLKLAPHFDAKALCQALTLRPGLMEAIMIIVMFNTTDFFQRRWVFEQANNAIIEEIVLKKICFDKLHIFEKPEHFLKLIHAIDVEHDPKKRSCKRCKVNPNKKQLNWAWFQMMNHLYYWTTLDDHFIINQPHLLEKTKQDLKNWEPYFECGFKLSKNNPPPNIPWEIYLDPEEAKAKPKPSKPTVKTTDATKKLHSLFDQEPQTIKKAKVDTVSTITTGKRKITISEEEDPNIYQIKRSKYFQKADIKSKQLDLSNSSFVMPISLKPIKTFCSKPN